MATETDLCGLGMAPQLAAKLGAQPSNIIGVGTAQSGAPTILTKNATIQSATGATAAILNPSADLGTQYWVVNPGTIASAASALIFVPVGHTLSNGTNAVINQPYTLPAFSAVILWQAQLKQWYVK
jgi:hypothetical protein